MFCSVALHNSQLCSLLYDLLDYRGRARKAEGKDRGGSEEDLSRTKKYIYKDGASDGGGFHHNHRGRGGQSRKHQCPVDVEVSGGHEDGGRRLGRGQEAVIMAEYCEEDGDILDMEADDGGIPGCDKYNVHGVKLERNGFI